MGFHSPLIRPSLLGGSIFAIIPCQLQALQVDSARHQRRMVRVGSYPRHRPRPPRQIQVGPRVFRHGMGWLTPIPPSLPMSSKYLLRFGVLGSFRYVFGVRSYLQTQGVWKVKICFMTILRGVYPPQCHPLPKK